jgi:hypothetical protein
MHVQTKEAVWKFSIQYWALGQLKKSEFLFKLRTVEILILL